MERKFAEFLIDKGVLTRRDYSKAVRLAESINLPIGSMAYQRGILTYGDIAKVIDYQIDKDLLFGEAAIELGLMTQEQVDELLELQRKLFTSEIEVLTITTGLATERIKEEYKLFLKEQIKKDTEALEF